MYCVCSDVTVPPRLSHTHTHARTGFGGDSIIFGVGTHIEPIVDETRLLTHGYEALQQVALGSVCKRKQRTTALRLTHISLLMFIALRFAVTRLRQCHRHRRRRSRNNVTNWMKRLQYVTPTTSGSSSNGDGNGGGTVARIQIEILFFESVESYQRAWMVAFATYFFTSSI